MTLRKLHCHVVDPDFNIDPDKHLIHLAGPNDGKNYGPDQDTDKMTRIQMMLNVMDLDLAK